MFSSHPQDNMYPAIRVNQVGKLANLKIKGGHLKWSLHLASAKKSEISSSLRAATVTLHLTGRHTQQRQSSQ